MKYKWIRTYYHTWYKLGKIAAENNKSMGKVLDDLCNLYYNTRRTDDLEV